MCLSLLVGGRQQKAWSRPSIDRFASSASLNGPTIGRVWGLVFESLKAGEELAPRSALFPTSTSTFRHLANNQPSQNGHHTAVPYHSPKSPYMICETHRFGQRVCLKFVFFCMHIPKIVNNFHDLLRLITTFCPFVYTTMHMDRKMVCICEISNETLASRTWSFASTVRRGPNPAF